MNIGDVKRASRLICSQLKKILSLDFCNRWFGANTEGVTQLTIFGQLYRSLSCRQFYLPDLLS